MPCDASGSSGTGTPSARAMSPKHWKPLRRHSRAGTVGAALGDSARYMAAESSTESSAVTHEDSGRGERNRTSGKYVVWLSATSAAQFSQAAYSSGRVWMVEAPEPSA